MFAKRHRHAALTDPLARLLERAVAEQRRASANELVRAGSRLPIACEEAGARPVEDDEWPHG